MFDADHLWVILCFSAIIFTGIRGYQRKCYAVNIPYHQHLHLVSTIITTLICSGIVAFNQPEIPKEYGSFFILCLLNGVGYALAGICNFGAVKHLKLSTFQSVSKLTAFLPIIIFYFVLGESEQVSNLNLIGILLSVFPILLLTYIEPENKNSENKNGIATGLSYLLLYLIVVSSMQIINAIVVKNDLNFSLGADPFLFIICTNALSLPYMMFNIIKTKEKINVSKKLLTSGSLLGLVNTASISCYLFALSTGVASLVVPLYAYNTFVSTTLLQVFPLNKPKALSKKSKMILWFLILWIAVSILILIFGEQV